MARLLALAGGFVTFACSECPSPALGEHAFLLETTGSTPSCAFEADGFTIGSVHVFDLATGEEGVFVLRAGEVYSAGFGRPVPLVFAVASDSDSAGCLYDTADSRFNPEAELIIDEPTCKLRPKVNTDRLHIRSGGFYGGFTLLLSGPTGFQNSCTAEQLSAEYVETAGENARCSRTFWLSEPDR